MNEIKRIAIHFGAGNIGRGLICDIYDKNDIFVLLIDTNKELVNKLNTEKKYKILFDNGEQKELQNFLAFTSVKDIPNYFYKNLDFISTSIGTQNFSKIIDSLHFVLEQNQNNFVNIIGFENDYRASTKLKQMLISDKKINFSLEKVFFFDCLVDRIVPLQQSKTIDISTENFYEIKIDKSNSGEHLNTLKFVDYVDNFESFVYRKLWVINATHCFLAFNFTKYKFVHEIQKSKNYNEISKEINSWKLILKNALTNKYKFDSTSFEEYFDFNLKRFFNPILKDEMVRLRRNPIKKLGQEERMISLYNAVKNDKDLDIHLLCKTIVNIYKCTEENEEQELIKNYIEQNGLKTAIQFYSQLNEEEAEEIIKKSVK